MKVLDAIYKRKSIRKFKDEIVPKEDILKMLEAATQAPSPLPQTCDAWRPSGTQCRPLQRHRRRRHPWR